MNLFNISFVLATCCLLRASGNSASYNNAYDDNGAGRGDLKETQESRDCDQGSSDDKTSNNFRYKVLGYQSLVNHESYSPGIKPVITAPISAMKNIPIQSESSRYVTGNEASIQRTAEFEPARNFNAAPFATASVPTPLLETGVPVEPLLRTNRPVAPPKQLINRDRYDTDTAPALVDAPLPKFLSSYVTSTEAPIQRTAEFEPARIFNGAQKPIASVVRQPLETRKAAKPLLTGSRPIATSMQMIYSSDNADPAPELVDAPLPKTASNYVYATEAPIMRTAEFGPARNFNAAPFATASVPTPLLETGVPAEPLLRINRPVAPPMQSIHRNRYDADPTSALVDAPLPKFLSSYVTGTEPPIQRTAEFEPARIFNGAQKATAFMVRPLSEIEIAAELLSKNNGPLTFRNPNSYNKLLWSDNQEYGQKSIAPPITNFIGPKKDSSVHIESTPAHILPLSQFYAYQLYDGNWWDNKHSIPLPNYSAPAAQQYYSPFTIQYNTPKIEAIEKKSCEK